MKSTELTRYREFFDGARYASSQSGVPQDEYDAWRRTAQRRDREEIMSMYPETAVEFIRTCTAQEMVWTGEVLAYAIWRAPSRDIIAAMHDAMRRYPEDAAAHGIPVIVDKAECVVTHVEEMQPRVKTYEEASAHGVPSLTLGEFSDLYDEYCRREAVRAVGGADVFPDDPMVVGRVNLFVRYVDVAVQFLETCNSRQLSYALGDVDDAVKRMPLADARRLLDALRVAVVNNPEAAERNGAQSFIRTSRKCIDYRLAAESGGQEGKSDTTHATGRRG